MRYEEVAVGQIVYPGYTPAKAGKIIRVDPEFFDPAAQPYPAYRHNITVKQANGKTYTIASANVTLYEELIEDHRRKLKRHEEMMEKLKAI